MNDKIFDLYLHAAAGDVLSKETKKMFGYQKRKIKLKRILRVSAAAMLIIIVTTSAVYAVIKKFSVDKHDDYLSIYIEDNEKHSDRIDKPVQIKKLSENWSVERVFDDEYWSIARLTDGSSIITIRKEVFSNENAFSIDDNYGTPSKILRNGIIYYLYKYENKSLVIFVNDYTYIISSEGVDLSTLTDFIDNIE